MKIVRLTDEQWDDLGHHLAQRDEAHEIHEYRDDYANGALGCADCGCTEDDEDAHGDPISHIDLTPLTLADLPAIARELVEE